MFRRRLVFVCLLSCMPAVAAGADQAPYIFRLTVYTKPASLASTPALALSRRGDCQVSAAPNPVQTYPMAAPIGSGSTTVSVASLDPADRLNVPITMAPGHLPSEVVTFACKVSILINGKNITAHDGHDISAQTLKFAFNSLPPSVTLTLDVRNPALVVKLNPTPSPRPSPIAGKPPLFAQLSIVSNLQGKFVPTVVTAICRASDAAPSNGVVTTLSASDTASLANGDWVAGARNPDTKIAASPLIVGELDVVQGGNHVEVRLQQLTKAVAHLMSEGRVMRSVLCKLQSQTTGPTYRVYTSSGPGTFVTVAPGDWIAH